MVIDFNASNSANRSAQTGATTGKRDAAAESTRPAEKSATQETPAAEAQVKLSPQAQQLQSDKPSVKATIKRIAGVSPINC
jgi:hypothetical protein